MKGVLGAVEVVMSLHNQFAAEYILEYNAG